MNKQEQVEREMQRRHEDRERKVREDYDSIFHSKKETKCIPRIQEGERNIYNSPKFLVTMKLADNTEATFPSISAAVVDLNMVREDILESIKEGTPVFCEKLSQEVTFTKII